MTKHKPILRFEMKKCRKKNCRCAHGSLHGPYCYAYFRENGRLKSKYIRKGQHPSAAHIDALGTEAFSQGEILRAQFKRLKTLCSINFETAAHLKQEAERLNELSRRNLAISMQVLNGWR